MVPGEPTCNGDGWEGGGDLEIGSTRAPRLCERNARFPGLDIARYAAGKDHRALGAAQHVGGLLDQSGAARRSTGGMKRAASIGGSGSASFSLLHARRRD